LVRDAGDGLSVERIRLDDPYDPVIHRQLLGMMVETYATPGAALDQAYGQSTHLYLARRPHGVVGCLFVAWERQTVANEPREMLYCGQGLVSRAFRRQGILHRMLTASCRDAVVQEARSGTRVQCWARTAVPAIPLLLAKVFAGREPGPMGEFSAEGLAVARMARRHFGCAPEAAGEHPFLLRAATRVRFTDREAAEIAPERAARSGNPYGLLFQGWDLRERDGDRMVLYFRLPDPPSGWTGTPPPAESRSRKASIRPNSSRSPR
jgi:hypothetical protein